MVVNVRKYMHISVGWYYWRSPCEHVIKTPYSISYGFSLWDIILKSDDKLLKQMSEAKIMDASVGNKWEVVMTSAPRKYLPLHELVSVTPKQVDFYFISSSPSAQRFNKPRANSQIPSRSPWMWSCVSSSIHILIQQCCKPRKPKFTALSL